jgi:ribosomal-protein-alanine N-acetyltransferase
MLKDNTVKIGLFAMLAHKLRYLINSADCCYLLPMILETDRLTLKHVALTDAPFIIELLNTKGWLKYIGDRNVKTLADAENYIANGPLKSYTENGYGPFKIISKLHNTPIGICGFYKREFLENPDVGYALLPGYEGKGYAYEALTAIIDYARVLNFSELMAFTMMDNLASVKLLKKAGFGYVKQMTDKGQELSLYSKVLNES